jgi:PiT family inorganic phosphate transporter
VAHVGIRAIVWNGIGKTSAAIVLSPMTGLALALLLVLFVSWAFVRAVPARVDGIFRRVQFVSASLYSLGHGGNDAQKTMGIIAALLTAHAQVPGAFHVPFWVVISCNGAMALGTLLGGWRIVRTMGSRITRLTPVQGVCAETAGSITLFLATGLGIPVSTTHTITGAIVGVGAARRASAVRWNVAQRIVIAWVITMPAAALIGAVFYGLASLIR